MHPQDVLLSLARVVSDRACPGRSATAEATEEVTMCSPSTGDLVPPPVGAPVMYRSHTMTRTVTVRSYLRPLRMGFVVDPRDRLALAKVFELSTCLWGGVFNPIIPAVQRVPRAWRNPVGRTPSAEEIRRGYIEAFEPDVLVVAREQDRTLAEGREAYLFDEVFSKARFDPPLVRVGRSVLEHYQNLYEDAFQFVMRDPPRVVEPIAHEAKHELFVSAVFGSFNQATEPLKTVRSWYRKGFAPEELRIAEDTLVDAFDPSTLFPLRLNSLRLKVRGDGHGDLEGAFVLDPTDPLDLVDFWNLRALGRRLAPIPIQWGRLLLGEIAHGRHCNEEAYLVTASRSVGLERTKALLEEIGWPSERHTVIDHGYPRLWDSWGRAADQAVRPTVYARETETEVGVADDDFVTIPVVRPSESERMANMLHPPVWCNVVEYRDFHSRSRVATVIPSGIRRPRDILHEEARVTSEGIVFDRVGAGTVRFKLPLALSVCKAWFAEQGMEVDLSAAGRTMQQLLDALEGLAGVWTILHQDLLRILDRMAAGLVEETVSPDADEGGADTGKAHLRAPRRRRKRYVPENEFLGKIAEVANRQGRRPDLHMEALLGKGIIRVGGGPGLRTVRTEELVCSR